MAPKLYGTKIFSKMAAKMIHAPCTSQQEILVCSANIWPTWWAVEAHLGYKAAQVLDGRQRGRPQGSGADTLPDFDAFFEIGAGSCYQKPKVKKCPKKNSNGYGGTCLGATAYGRACL
jgi:hypothetical protein